MLTVPAATTSPGVTATGRLSPVSRDWSTVDVWWGDERFLPAEHPDRNDAQARHALLDDLPLDLQAKLLRVLEEGAVRRLGSTKPRKINVRFITATNRNLQMEVARGRFREDLFYRLNVIPVYLPPLRKRRNDIPLLSRHFLNRFRILCSK